jgi:hypothetical protein
VALRSSVATGGRTIPHLQDDPTGAHVAAFGLGEYKEFLRLVREEPPNTLAGLKVLEDLLDEFAVIKLPDSRSKWDQRVGGLVTALGLAPVGTSAHSFFASDWDWQNTPEESALAIAQDNLREAARKGSKLSTQVAAELVATAWRDDALARLQSVARGQPQWFLEMASWAAPPLTGEAPEARSELLYELAERVGGFAPLGEALDGSYWWDLWRLVFELSRRRGRRSVRA